MNSAKLESRSAYGALSAVRARRAGRQILVSNIVVVVAFLFVGAVVFGLVG